MNTVREGSGSEEAETTVAVGAEAGLNAPAAIRCSSSPRAAKGAAGAQCFSRAPLGRQR
jgi:hypothetical protein